MVCAKHVAGVAADISHAIIKSKVTGSQLADDELRLEPTEASFVFIPAVVASEFATGLQTNTRAPGAKTNSIVVVDH